MAAVDERLLAEYRQKFPPLITLSQAAEIAHVPLATAYDWSARKVFDGFKFKPGRSVLLSRDAFIEFLLKPPVPNPGGEVTPPALEKGKSSNGQVC